MSSRVLTPFTRPMPSSLDDLLTSPTPSSQNPTPSLSLGPPRSFDPLKIALKFNRPTMYVIYREKRSGKLKKRKIPLRHLVNDDLTIRMTVTMPTRQIVEELCAKHEVLKSIKLDQIERLIDQVKQHHRIQFVAISREKTPSPTPSLHSLIPKPVAMGLPALPALPVKPPSPTGSWTSLERISGTSSIPVPVARSASPSFKPEVVDGSKDLNKLSDQELNEIKARMHKDFEKNLLKPGDPGFIYEVNKSFEGPKESNEWDDSDSDSLSAISNTRVLASNPRAPMTALGDMETEEDIEEEFEEDFENDEDGDEEDDEREVVTDVRERGLLASTGLGKKTEVTSDRSMDSSAGTLKTSTSVQPTHLDAIKLQDSTSIRSSPLDAIKPNLTTNTPQDSTSTHKDTINENAATNKAINNDDNDDVNEKHSDDDTEEDSLPDLPKKPTYITLPKSTDSLTDPSSPPSHRHRRVSVSSRDQQVLFAESLEELTTTLVKRSFIPPGLATHMGGGGDRRSSLEDSVDTSITSVGKSSGEDLETDSEGEGKLMSYVSAPSLLGSGAVRRPVGEGKRLESLQSLGSVGDVGGKETRSAVDLRGGLIPLSRQLKDARSHLRTRSSSPCEEEEGSGSHLALAQRDGRTLGVYERDGSAVSVSGEGEEGAGEVHPDLDAALERLMEDLEEDDEGVEGGVKPISSRVVGSFTDVTRKGSGGVEMSGGGEKEDVGAQSTTIVPESPVPVEGDAGLTMKVSEMVGAEVKEDTGLAAKAPNDVEFNAGLEKVQEAINGEVKEAAESQPPIPLPTIAQPTTASGSLFPSLPTTDTLDPASNPQEQTRSLAVPVLRIHAEDGSLLPDDTHTNEYIDDAFEDDFVEEDIIDDDDDFFDQPLTRPTVENTIIEPENTVIPKPALTPLNSMPLKPVMGGLGALPPLQSKLPALLPGMKPLASTTSTSVLGAPKSLDSLDAKPTLSHDIHPTPSQTSPSSDATPPLSNVTTSTPNVKPTPDTKPPPDIFTDRDSEEDIDLDDDIDNLLGSDKDSPTTAHRRLLDSNTHWLKQPSPDVNPPAAAKTTTSLLDELDYSDDFGVGDTVSDVSVGSVKPGKMSWLEGGGIGEVLEEEEDFAFDVDVEDEASLEVDGEDAF